MLELNQAVTQVILDYKQENPGFRGPLFNEIEKGYMKACMELAKGNQSQACQILGVSRGTLRTKLKFHFGTTHVSCVDGKCTICTFLKNNKKDKG